MNIDKNIPIPAKRSFVNQKRRKYPFEDMEVGDSFFMAADGIDNQRVMLKRVTSRINKLLPKRYTARMVEGGVRVWRISDSTMRLEMMTGPKQHVVNEGERLSACTIRE